MKKACVIVYSSSLHQGRLIRMNHTWKHTRKPVGKRLGQDLVVCSKESDWSPILQQTSIALFKSQ